MTTFPHVLHALLRQPSRPFVTFYDDATGERVELSVATWANWVAKASGLLTEECELEPGQHLAIDLPPHWLGTVFLAAAWNAGIAITDQAATADAVVCGPDTVASYADSAHARPVLACALRPLGVRFVDGVPPGVRDVGIEIWTQPDAFWTPTPPDDSSLALAVTSGPVSHAELFAGGGDSRRVLTVANPVTDGLPELIAALLGHGSLVLVAHEDPSTRERRILDERIT